MAPTIKFIYFPTRGAGEAIRFLLKYGGIEFEDVRTPMDKWPEIKPTTPFGQLPLLEVDGKVACQSTAIARYLAKQVDLVGDTDWENLEIDAIVATIVDLLQKLHTWFHEKDPELKQAAHKEVVNEIFPFYFSRLDKLAKENNGHLAAGKLTWADVYFSSFEVLFGKVTGDNALEKYPNLQKVVTNVLEIPSIKAWVESRPKTDM